MIEFFHVREERLNPGDLILPGRWGGNVLQRGKDHPFYFREHLLDIWRKKFTKVPISRLACTYAHESFETARYYSDAHDHIYRVVPVTPGAPSVRLDMLWLTWMGESGKTSDSIAEWCAAYWAGKATSAISPTATSSWEWLFPCPLRVEEDVTNRL
jgi:hypothetical protein